VGVVEAPLALTIDRNVQRMERLPRFEVLPILID